MTTPETRRPLRSRTTAWARWMAAKLSRTAVTPNQISLASIGFAAVAAAILVWSPGGAWFIAAAACVQLRLLCNLLDGMVAVEGGKKTPDGDLYNELPDRVADVLVIAGMGYAAGTELYIGIGWAASVLAVMTAYVRAFGASLGALSQGGQGASQDFSGILSKPRRMALVTATCLVAVWEGPSHTYALQMGLCLLLAGTAWTVVTRTRALARRMRDTQ